MRSFIIILLSFVISEFAWSQRVQVVNSSTGFPIADVEITFENLNDTLYTDFEGYFEADSMPQDQVVRFLHPVFFEEAKTMYDIARNKNIVSLKPAMELSTELSISLLNIIEYAKDLPFHIDIIDMDDARNAGLSEWNDNLKTADLFLMQRRTEGEGNSFLRGFSSRRVLLAVDGVRLSNAINKNGIVPVSFPFHSTRLLRTQFIEGAGSSFYANDQTGGVIHYFVKKPRYLDETDKILDIMSNLQYATHLNKFVTETDISLSFKRYTTNNCIPIKNTACTVSI